ncbi:MAG TPA: hypothetical protein VMU39_25800 [Solirubrobacteraceae bacterium]|nr:hypothetical protein [Solirubrobacteraceae bacterium]
MLPRGPAWPELPPAKSVILRLDPESLLVRFIADDGSETPLTFRRYHFNLQEKRYDDLFTCYPSDAGARLRFMAEPESHSSTSPLVVEAGGTLVFLLRASDGSLIVQWRSESLSIWATMIGSHMRFDSVWWQFPPTLQSD